MFYIVEIQKDAAGNCAHLVQTAANRNEAESQYHRVLQYAAVSPLTVHGAIVFSEECFPLLHQCYRHESAVTPDAPEEA